MTLSLLPKNAFPLPAPLAPNLVALGLDKKSAEALSKVHFSSALTLKATCEAEYISACTALLAASDERGYSSKELRSKLLTVAITRYLQALSKWENEARQRAEASLLQRGKKVVLQPKLKGTAIPPSKHSRKGSPRVCSKDERTNADVESIPFGTNRPPHAFPQPYPPPVKPKPVTFVTHIPLLRRGSKCVTRVASDSDLDACITALSQLSLGRPSTPSRNSHNLSKATLKPRSRTCPASNPKLTSQLSPSRPRLVSPILDTSVAVSHKPLPKHTPSYPSLPTISRTHNIDIPRSDRRKACSIPYRRPTIQPSTSPESPPSSLSCGIHRTPSLVSDHGSEASSPSTPPNFPSMPIPTPTFAHKSSFPETMSSLEHSPTRYSVWHDIDFGTDLYG